MPPRILRYTHTFAVCPVYWTWLVDPIVCVQRCSLHSRYVHSVYYPVSSPNLQAVVYAMKGGTRVVRLVIVYMFTHSEAESCLAIEGLFKHTTMCPYNYKANCNILFL